MKVKEVHPKLSEEERSKRIGYITDELLRLAAKNLKKKQMRSEKSA